MELKLYAIGVILTTYAFVQECRRYYYESQKKCWKCKGPLKLIFQDLRNRRYTCRKCGEKIAVGTPVFVAYYIVSLVLISYLCFGM